MCPAEKGVISPEPANWKLFTCQRTAETKLETAFSISCKYKAGPWDLRNIHICRMPQFSEQESWRVLAL
jgi:hypothetical protein